VLSLTLSLGLNLELKHRYNAPYIITTSIHPTYAQTPLVDSFSKSLATSKPQVLDAKDVGGIITNQIFSLQGGELVIPEVNSVGTLFRGLPSWLKAVIFDGTKDHVIAG
jgi:all-trans-retinol dehydrogenase (NAD+)